MVRNFPLPRRRPCFFSAAFSLVEVVISIGIVSFALLTIIGLFGGIMRSSGDNTQRREMTEAVDSLRAFLTEEAGFTNAYNWAKSGTSLVYVTYKSGANNIPDAGSITVVGMWTNATSELEAYEAARSGSWLRAKLSVSPLNPSGTNLPPIAQYANRAGVFIVADIDAIAQPGQENSISSRLQSTFAILK